MQDRVVSSQKEQLILVDDSDNEVGYLSKVKCHDGDGVLHRAFSVFVFDNDGDLLLQQRGKEKRLWPGYWSNSCCSHPRKGESMQLATKRRLHEELGISIEVEFAYQFQYQASFGEVGSENELCSVYLGRLNEEVHPNPTEIDAIRFLSVEALNTEMRTQADTFTPWFKQEWETLNNDHWTMLEHYIVGAAFSRDQS